MQRLPRRLPWQFASHSQQAWVAIVSRFFSIPAPVRSVHLMAPGEHPRASRFPASNKMGTMIDFPSTILTRSLSLVPVRAGAIWSSATAGCP